MSDVISLTVVPILKIFVMFAAGIIAAKIKVMDESATEKVTALMMQVICPCVLFSSYLIEYDKERLHGLIIAIFLSAAAHLLGMVFGPLFFKKKDGTPWDVARSLVIISNCAYIGIPLVQSMFSAEAVLYATGYIMVTSIVNWTYIYMLFSGKSADIKSVAKAFVSPNMIAIYLGIIVYVCRIKIPAFIADPITSIGSCNTPIALIIAGAAAFRADLKSILKNKLTYIVIVLRHFIVPGCLLFVMKLAGFSSLAAASVFALAACPTGANTVMFAGMFGRDEKFAAGVFGLSTVLCLVTLPIMMYVMSIVL